MLGDTGVGKTALTHQFTTSDYICAYDLSLGKIINCVFIALYGLWHIVEGHIYAVSRIKSLKREFCCGFFLWI